MKQAAATHSCGPYHGRVFRIWKEAILLVSQIDVSVGYAEDSVMR